MLHDAISRCSSSIDGQAVSIDLKVASAVTGKTMTDLLLEGLRKLLKKAAALKGVEKK